MREIDPKVLEKMAASARRTEEAKRVRDRLQRLTRKLLKDYDADLVMFALEGCWGIAHQQREEKRHENA